MQSFKDIEAREWNLSLNNYTLKAVRDGAGVLLTKIADDNFKMVADLYSDSLMLGEVLWCMIEKQADERKLTPEDFAQSLAGDAIKNAADALLRAIADFFSNPAREVLLQMIETANKVQDRAQAMAMEQMKKELANLDVDQLAKNSMASYLNTPESPELTRGRLRSAS